MSSSTDRIANVDGALDESLVARLAVLADEFRALACEVQGLSERLREAMQDNRTG